LTGRIARAVEMGLTISRYVFGTVAGRWAKCCPRRPHAYACEAVSSFRQGAPGSVSVSRRIWDHVIAALTT
jgi:hypothetical protein